MAESHRKGVTAMEEQLIMRWKHDGLPPQPPVFPEGVTVQTFRDLEDPIDQWRKTVAYMGGDYNAWIAENPDYYRKHMLSYRCFRDDQVYFLAVNGEIASTITVICDYENLEGYIHMVACKSQFRGQGLGTLMNTLAVAVLKREGMQSAYLTTDDWRIPAIKSYLRAGFLPELAGDPSFPARWEAIRKVIGH